MNSLLLLLALALPQGPELPPPRGLVNDFAGVIDAPHAERIERIAEYVRARSGGEIAVVTMKDIGGRDVGDVALRIGREWRVGAMAPVGDRKRNAGVVILVVPKETAADGRGRVYIATGQGTEGFIPDGGAGDIWRAAVPRFEQRDYGGAIEQITYSVAMRYAGEFGFSMDSLGFAPAQAPRQAQSRRSSPFGGAIVGMVVLFLLISLIGGRRGGGGLASALPWIILSQMGGGRRGGGDWGGGWGGGGGGGGFGGFGGGGGFSGGGSGGSW